MDTVIILLILTSVLLIVLSVFAVKYFILKSKIRKLNSRILKFLENGELTDFDLHDSEFSSVINNISDLENRLLLEKSNTEAENKKNADFAADISHQLKTPLAGLRLYLEMDAQSDSGGRSEKELQLVSKMEKLVYNLLRLEKIRSDTYEMNFSKNSVDEIINIVFADFRPLFPEKSFTLSGCAKLRCDREWISEAFGNIIKNAAEHTPVNGIIDVTIENGEKSLTVIIEDNGGGVSPEQLPLIFGRFYKTENASPESTGVGLAISKAIFEKHHGTVYAENGKEGLRVIICLPVIEGMEKIN